MATKKAKMTTNSAQGKEGFGLLPVDLGPVTDGLRQVWTVGLGAIMLTWDGVDSLANRLVKRGELVEQDGKKILKKVMDQPKKTADMAEEEVDRRVREMLVRMNIPTMRDIMGMNYSTRSDIEELNDKIAALNRNLGQLRKAGGPQREQTEAMVEQVEILTREVGELKALEEPQAEAAEKLAGKVGTLNRKISELVQAKEEPAPAKKNDVKEPAVAKQNDVKEKAPAKQNDVKETAPARQNEVKEMAPAK